MPKPVHVVTEYRTHRQEVRETIDRALPRRNPVLGLMLGFACTIALVWAAASLTLAYFGGS